MVEHVGLASLGAYARDDRPPAAPGRPRAQPRHRPAVLRAGRREVADPALRVPGRRAAAGRRRGGRAAGGRARAPRRRVAARALRAHAVGLDRQPREHRDAIVAEVGEPRERAWLLYLIGSALAFEDADISVFQVLAARPGADARPAADARRRARRRSGLSGGRRAGGSAAADRLGHAAGAAAVRAALPSCSPEPPQLGQRSSPCPASPAGFVGGGDVGILRIIGHARPLPGRARRRTSAEPPPGGRRAGRPGRTRRSRARAGRVGVDPDAVRRNEVGRVARGVERLARPAAAR